MGDRDLTMQSSPALNFPKSITSLKDILDEKVEHQQIVNVVGLATDFRPPIETRGKGKGMLRPSLQLDDFPDPYIETPLANPSTSRLEG